MAALEGGAAPPADVRSHAGDRALDQVPAPVVLLSALRGAARGRDAGRAAVGRRAVVSTALAEARTAAKLRRDARRMAHGAVDGVAASVARLTAVVAEVLTREGVAGMDRGSAVGE